MKRKILAIFLTLIFLFPLDPLFSENIVSPDYVGTVKTLLELFGLQNSQLLSREELASPSLLVLSQLKTAGGFRLHLRLYDFGISLVEALKIARDPLLKKRNIELARWAKNPNVRADALLAVATAGDPAHKPIFQEAMLDENVNIQFAVVEALQEWRQPAAVELLRSTRNLKWDPLLNVFAAQALLSFGETDALSTLWEGLESPNWVVRAMSAHYLGDFARPTDYRKMVTYLSREARNDYVTAEICVAALKLLSKLQSPAAASSQSYSAASPGWKNNDEVKYTVGDDGVVNIEPLIIVPPRLRIRMASQIDAQIDNELLRLFQSYLDVPPEFPINTPDLGQLLQLTTPTGYALRLRYAPNMSYLLLEGLAGSNDLRLRGQMQKAVEKSTNADARVAALIALAYDHDAMDWTMIQQALQDKNPVIRFGGLEAAEVGRFVETLPMITQVATNDPIPAFQVYAAYLMTKFGQPAGHSLLISATNNSDWPARAMSFWFLGRYGEDADYTLMLDRMGPETNPYVKTEITLAALRLAPL